MAKKNKKALREEQKQARMEKVKQKQLEKPIHKIEQEAASKKSHGNPRHGKTVDIFKADSWMVDIELLSPMHLSSGQGDINVDADIVHDAYGLPFFPAKRFKGLLYESALEVAEMAELAQLPFGSGAELAELFQRSMHSSVQLVIHDFRLPEWRTLQESWGYLEHQYPEIVQPEDVLNEYTSLRYQTKIDRKTGTAADTSLHNLRVLREKRHFCGKIELTGASRVHRYVLLLALRNLMWAGMKRNRGFGRIRCKIEDAEMDELIATAFGKDAM